MLDAVGILTQRVALVDLYSCTPHLSRIEVDYFESLPELRRSRAHSSACCAAPNHATSGLLVHPSTTGSNKRHDIKLSFSRNHRDPLASGCLSQLLRNIPHEPRQGSCTTKLLPVSALIPNSDTVCWRWLPNADTSLMWSRNIYASCSPSLVVRRSELCHGHHTVPDSRSNGMPTSYRWCSYQGIVACR